MSHISQWAAAALLATTSLAWADIPNPLRIATEGA